MRNMSFVHVNGKVSNFWLIAILFSLLLMANGISFASATPQISAGEYHSLALKSDGTVWAWGNNSDGQLGDRETINRRIPVEVLGLKEVIAIAGESTNSLVLKSDGTVWVWGNNSDGQLGDGTTKKKYFPVQTQGLKDVIAIAGGNSHGIALKSNGTVWTWGNNKNGQLGDNTTTNRNIPVQIYKFK